MTLFQRGGNDTHFVKRGVFTLTLHKNVSTGIADMLEMVAFSGQMLDT